MKTYPKDPGYKGEAETSPQAAARVAPNAKVIRKLVFAQLLARDLTHDECAAAIRPAGMTDVQFESFKRSVRSRGSELKASGQIGDSGVRRVNSSGSWAVVWRVLRRQTAKVVIQKQTVTQTATQTELL